MVRSILVTIGIFSLAFSGIGAVKSKKHHQTVSVQVGNAATEKRSKIKVEFVEMVEDSRCPKDVNCVWAGNAKIKIKVSKGKMSQTIELNSGMANKDNTFAGYTLTLDKLTPEPASNVRIDKNGYVAVILMKKVA